MIRVMVFNVTFNNISVISRRSVLLVDETREPQGINEIDKIGYDNYLYSREIDIEF